MSATIILNSRDRETLASVLSQFANEILRVSVFGSRATGAARSSSDLDLVFYGDIDPKVERRIWTLLNESSLPISVDLVVYDRIQYAPLKEHIDAVARPLFSQKELKARRKQTLR